MYLQNTHQNCYVSKTSVAVDRNEQHFHTLHMCPRNTQYNNMPLFTPWNFGQLLTTLDGDTLRTEAATEKEGLITELRETLEQTSRKALLEADKDEAEFLQEKLSKVPYPIYIG